MEFNPSYKDTILLCGSGRSGTTWLADLINDDNQFRYMFEPFHPENVQLVSHLNSRQYLRASDKSEKYLLPAERIFSGKVRNLWIDRYNKKIFPQKRLIKDIRINLLLRWIKTNFSEIPLVFVLRHPFAVALSRIRLGWENHLDEIFDQNHFIEDCPISIDNRVTETASEFEKQIILWCIENYTPITALKKEEIYILFYENLYRDPHKELTSLFDYLNLSLSDSISEKIRIPSPMTKKNSPLVTGLDPLLHWKKTLDRGQIDNALDIMSKFGLDKIYRDEPLPDPSGIEELRQS